MGHVRIFRLRGGDPIGPVCVVARDSMGRTRFFRLRVWFYWTTRLGVMDLVCVSAAFARQCMPPSTRTRSTKRASMQGLFRFDKLYGLKTVIGECDPCLCTSEWCKICRIVNTGWGYWRLWIFRGFTDFGRKCKKHVAVVFGCRLCVVGRYTVTFWLGFRLRWVFLRVSPSKRCGRACRDKQKPKSVGVYFEYRKWISLHD